MTTLWVWIGSPDDKLDVMRYVKPTEKDVLSHPFAAARISQLEAQLREREAECERLDEARIELKNLVQQWENWLSDLQADFVGLTAEKNQLHEWEWIEEHRCWPPCICEES